MAVMLLLPRTLAAPVLYTVETLVGDDGAANAHRDGVGTNAWVEDVVAITNHPLDTTVLYFTDQSANRLKKYDIPTGNVSTIIGDGNKGDGVGSALSSSVNMPLGLRWNASTDSMYFADSENNRVKKYDASTQTVSNLVGVGALGFPSGTLLVTVFSRQYSNIYHSFSMSPVPVLLKTRSHNSNAMHVLGR
ncbi:hypothetical protein AAMO2058_001274900 [Amorphochlora amoebiformis]